MMVCLFVGNLCGFPCCYDFLPHTTHEKNKELLLLTTPFTMTCCFVFFCQWVLITSLREAPMLPPVKLSHQKGAGKTIFVSMEGKEIIDHSTRCLGDKHKSSVELFFPHSRGLLN